ncbi:Glyoxalase family protein [Staphylococcus aureus]|nr:Glyoxalase family protein [Staphylococcus aureus]
MAFHDKTATQVTNIELNVRDLDLMTTFYKNILEKEDSYQDVYLG